MHGYVMPKNAAKITCTFFYLDSQITSMYKCSVDYAIKLHCLYNEATLLT
jgi:hypothetical protein